MNLVRIVRLQNRWTDAKRLSELGYPQKGAGAWHDHGSSVSVQAEIRQKKIGEFGDGPPGFRGTVAKRGGTCQKKKRRLPGLGTTRRPAPQTWRRWRLRSGAGGTTSKRSRAARTPKVRRVCARSRSFCLEKFRAAESDLTTVWLSPAILHTLGGTSTGVSKIGGRSL